jgi:hypothetical protein
VYDRNHHRRQITDAERQYWRDKFNRMTNGTTGTTGTTGVRTSSITPRENWSGFRRIQTRSATSTNAVTPRQSWGDYNRSRARSSVTTSSTDNSDRSRSWRHSSSSSAATTSSSSDDNSSDRGRGHRRNRD